MAYCGFNYIVIAAPHQNADSISDISLLPTVVFRLANRNKAIAGCFMLHDIKDLDHMPINSDWLQRLSRKHGGVIASPLCPERPTIRCEDCEFYATKTGQCLDSEFFVDAFFRIRVCRFHPNAAKLEHVEGEDFKAIPLQLIEVLDDPPS